MILVDVNLLVYAHNSRAGRHREAKAWWEAALTAQSDIALDWVTVIGFVRLTTNPKVMMSPLSKVAAVDLIHEWLKRSHVWIAAPGPRHWTIYAQLIKDHDLNGNSLTDGHLAAIAIENNWTLCSSD